MARAKRKVRYAVVGAGWISQEAFMPGVEHTGNSEMTAIVTGDPEKARQLGEHYKIPHRFGYDGYEAMLGAGLVDAIYLALPNTMHRDFAVPALERGLHVLLEKPVAPTVEACREINEAAARGNAKLMIAYRLHFEPATLAALETVRSGELGDIRLFSSVFAQQVSGHNHRAHGEYWAGPLQDMGTYPINAVRHLFAAEPTEVLAASAAAPQARFSTVPEMVTAVLRFPGERLAQFTVSYGGNGLDEYRVLGTKGDLQVDPAYTLQGALKHRITIGTTTKERKFPQVDQFGGELKYFSDCILKNRQPEPDGEEGLADVVVIKAVEAALASGRAEPIASPAYRRGPHPDQQHKLKPVNAPALVNAAAPENG